MRIVALHGQVGMASDWDGVGGRMSLFGNDLEAVDLWSCLEDGGVGLDEFGRELNAREADGQVLLGYSMGGRLALHALLDHPEKWKMAVIVSAHGGVSVEERNARRLVDDMWAEKALKLPWCEFLDEWNSQGVLGGDVMPDRGGLEARREAVARSFRCWSLAEQEVLFEKLLEVKIPILFVVGENDEKFRGLWVEACERMENAELVEISGAGHRVPWEAEEELVGVMNEWLKQCCADEV